MHNNNNNWIKKTDLGSPGNYFPDYFAGNYFQAVDSYFLMFDNYFRVED